MDKLKLLFLIFDRDEEERVLALTEMKNTGLKSVVFAEGTARTEWLSMLGIGSPDKLLILSVGNLEQIESLTVSLDGLEEFTYVGFTVPLSSVGGPASYQVLANRAPEKDR